MTSTDAIITNSNPSTNSNANNNYRMGTSTISNSNNLNDKINDPVAHSESRLLIVANRLPLSMSIKKAKDANGKPTDKNEITFTTSSGGLVSALKGCDMSMRWIGWPGGYMFLQLNHTFEQ